MGRCRALLMGEALPPFSDQLESDFVSLPPRRQWLMARSSPPMCKLHKAPSHVW